jgi:peptidoglycan hydrolase CwlO-like protein
MKLTTIVMLLVLTSILACGESEKAKALRKEGAEAGAAAKDYLKEKKDEFVAASEKELNQLGKEVDELRQKLATATADAREALKRKLDELEPKEAEAKKKLAELQAAAADRWEDLKTGTSNAIAEFKKAFKN